MEKKEAMKILKDFHDKSALFSVRTALDTIIPELRESEDERIRKELIDAINGLWDNDALPMPLSAKRKDAWIAWLEKQKEYESTDFEYVWNRTDCGDLTSALDKYSEEAIINMCHAWYDKGIELERKSWLEKQCYTKKDVDDAYLKGICYTKHELEKQDEQKPQRIVSAEAKEALYDKPTDEEMKELLRTEYEKGRADTIAEMYVPTQISPEESLGVSSEKYMDIVDTLTQGGQKPAKWSLEDERVIAIINNALTESNTPPDDYDKVYDWLESIKQRI